LLGHGPALNENLPAFALPDPAVSPERAEELDPPSPAQQGTIIIRTENPINDPFPDRRGDFITPAAIAAQNFSPNEPGTLHRALVTARPASAAANCGLMH
jgi:hypothetical protein